MGVDVCYTNHAEADSDDMDVLLTVLTAAGVAFVIAVRVPTMSCSDIRAYLSTTRCSRGGPSVCGGPGVQRLA
ncbi:ethanolamine ammonia-lyase large subunit domain protein [Mycobacteroides abscessus]|nr:ethanolamine ammonia-lyase large subunit domain protein [Mycobacteroides abscessus]